MINTHIRSRMRVYFTHMRTYKGEILKLLPHQIVVVGTNPQGRHGKGGALWALKNAGAILGQGFGLMGQTFGIITKDLRKRFHPSIQEWQIKPQISRLYDFARVNPQKEFLVLYHGKKPNLNGYSNEAMARMFWLDGNIPENICFEESFAELIMKNYNV